MARICWSSSSSCSPASKSCSTVLLFPS
jgi:hypothetical protein